VDKNFARSLQEVRQHEGGWVDHPSDPGGATMKGITLANFRRFIKLNATKADLRAITDEQVAVVLRRQYWDAVLGAVLPSGVDYAVFDFAVNSGPKRAITYLQQTVGTLQDGVLGPATLAAVKTFDPRLLIDRLNDKRLNYMRRITHKGKLLWPTFGTGWSRRVAAVRRTAKSMAV
jgi:lysozyme family protein